MVMALTELSSGTCGGYFYISRTFWSLPPVKHLRSRLMSLPWHFLLSNDTLSKAKQAHKNTS